MTISNSENINIPSSDEDVFIFPTSYAQKRMWFLDQFEPGSPYYNIPIAFKITGKFDEKLFAETVNIIADRHESIRTTFTSIKGEPQQVIKPELQFSIPTVDLIDEDEQVKEEKVKQLAKLEARKPFDLIHGPLFRVQILKLNTSEHVILITMHHIISDGWSMGILVGEITSIYSSLISNEPIQLEELEIQYADFSEWQNNYLTGEVLDLQLNYWKEKLGDSNSLLELPTDRNRQAVFTSNGSSLNMEIEKEIIEGLQKISYSENATMFMTLLAAFNVLLFRYTGQDDINVGTPIANRTDKDIEKIIGLFINTLVLRTKMNDNPTFKELLKQVRKTNLEAFDHQDLPFEMLVDAIQPERNMSYAPLFQVMMILQNNPVEATELSEVSVSMLDVDMGTSTSDITYSISTGLNGATCSIEYNTDLFDESTMIRMFEDFITLLQEIVVNPNSKISDYEILPQIRKQKILNEWSSRKLNSSKVKGIHYLVEEWAKKTPDEIAVIDTVNRISYKELNEKANRLANYLIERNSSRSKPIGISQNKTVNLLISIIGVLKAGYAYLPLDPRYPTDRLSYMVEDSKIELLLVDSHNSDIFLTFNEEKIVVDEFHDYNTYSHVNPSVLIDENNLAYIIYTSGSTGLPKGIMISHKSLVNYVDSITQNYNIQSNDNALQFSQISFDISVEEIFTTLCNGATLVMRDEDWISTVEIFLKKCEENSITILNLPTAYWHELVNEAKTKKYSIPKSIKTVIIGGEKALRARIEDWEDISNVDVNLFNTYGPTEATVVTTSWNYKKDDFNKIIFDEIPIGKPIYNIKVYILDKYLNVVPPGVKGELYIGGDSLARGYVNKPELTAEKFIPNKYSEIEGERIYRTGDIVKYLPDGNIEFIGRSDNQVKLRGFRIELGEIETALTENESVKDSIVIVKEDNIGGKKLIAYLTPQSNKEIDTTLIREHVAELVPDYMIPSAFVVMDKLPLTPNGKIDRKSLPEPDQSEIEKSFEVDYVAPSNVNEEKIVDIWKEVLKLEKIGVLHNFFTIGGHSLLATQIISRIKTEFKIDLPLRFIFEKPTVSDLAIEIERLKNTTSGLNEIKILPRKINEKIPLSFAQERLWFLDQLEPNSPFYNIPEFYKINGTIDLTILQEAFNKIIQRHESLRTYFNSEDGTPYQIIEDKHEIKFDLIDLSKLNNEDQESEVKKIISAESKEPISIGSLPLFRIKILKLASEVHIIAMNIHHIISDAWSSRVIISELGMYYESINKAIPLTLNKLNIQYADYAIWQREWLKDEILDKHIDYWKNKLTGIPALLELPTDYTRPKNQTFHGDFTSFELNTNIIENLIKVSKEEGTTVFMLLLAAFKLFLYKLSGQNDICVGTPNANRNREEIEPLIGFFVNTLALRTDCSNNPTFVEFLERIKETTLGAYAHQDLPFESIVDSVNPERNLSHSPIFQVMFVHQNAQDTKQNSSSKSSSNLEILPVESHSRTAKFDLTLFIVESNDEISGAFEFNTDLFNKSSINLFIKYFTKILTDVLEDKNLSIDQLKLLDEENQKGIIGNLNKVAPIPTLKNNVALEFHSVANKNQSKTSIDIEGKTYTYKDLEDDSNKLANYLIASGVGLEQIVGICLPRSYELIVSLLGILKSGAAYLPIDPNYPQDRINYILEDADVKTIITNNSLINLLDSNDATIINLDANNEEINKGNISYPNVAIDGTNICYVIYTSGSTGNPKGTLITHEGLTNYLSWTHNAYPFKQENGSLVHSTVSFDATVTSIFPSLLLGKKIVLMKESDEIDEIAKVIKESDKFSILKITPAHLELLSNLISAEEANNVADAMIIGGENLTTKQIQFWQKNSPETLLYNEYGPTEAVVGCVVFEGSKFSDDGSVPIGKVIPNMKVYVLDKNLVQVPFGVIGELYIGGISLARGYLAKPELTSERFIPNPFAKSEGERIYKTGDLVKIQNDGNLVFVGRVDDQVKVRGYRIELGEIEIQFSQFDEIKEAVVDVKEFGDDDKRIIAYIVAKSSIDHSEVIERLRSHIPEFMVPNAIVELDRIPLTINGKVDRKKLPMPEQNNRNENVEFIKPSTESEKAIYGIWKDVLKTESISVYDNFFDLGGHSLLVTKLVVRIEKQFNITFPIRNIFAYPTIAQLAKEIDSGNYRVSKLQLPSLKAYENKNNIPLSFTQRRLWFLDKLEPGQSIYNMPMAVKVNGKLEIEIVEKAIDYLANRHETLRTNFIENDGIPSQVISENHKIKLQVEDFTEIIQSEQENKILSLKKQETLLPFNLDDDALIRFKIAKLSDELFVIFFTMHHIISDGWSINIVLQEFVESYLSYLNNQEPNLKELEVQYSDFAFWQKENLEGEMLDKQIDYWTKKLENLPAVLELPIDKQRPLNKTFNGSHKSFVIEKSLLINVDDILRKYEITPFMFLLGTFQILLSKLSGQNDISVGTPVANRQHIETEGIIGFFANTLVIHNSVSGNSSIEEYFREVKTNALDAFENQDAPFEKLVELLKPERDLSNTPLFQVMFALQNNEQKRTTQSDILIEALESESTTTQYDLTLSMSTDDDSWSGTLEYNTDLFESSTIEIIINSYNSLIEEIISDEKKYIGELEYLTIEEKKLILNNSKAPSQKYSFTTVLDKFDEVVNLYPNRIACDYNGTLITYSELDKRSSNISKYLQNHDFNSEDIIGVMLPKSNLLIEWLIGIMKAGCSYMPIDPNYPKDRIDYMVMDSGVKAIVTDKNEINLASNISAINILELDVDYKNEDNSDTQLSISSANLAYVIYTSGSTGKPKGVMLQHKGLLNLVENQIIDFHVSNESRVLQFASISFDASISEIFMALLSGATLVLADKDKLSDAINVHQFIIENKISVVTLPPSLLQVMSQNKLENLKSLISAGEKLTSENALKWSDNRNLINAYGPTEATVGVSSYEVQNISKKWGSVPVGKPINNIELFILDPELNLVRNGTVGEIFIGGISLARGYINKPELTAEKFIPNPYSFIEGDRIYRTGDLGKFNSDGVIEYIGRIDEQVKLRGFRIELSEIEIVLKSLNEIDEAVVIVNGNGENANLVAYIQKNIKDELNLETIKLKLSRKLPDYMIPGIVVELEKIPITTNGKIDRKKLPELNSIEKIVDTEYVAATNETEEKLVAIWQELLSIPKVGINDNFFEIGGHSLLAVRLLNKISAEFEIELPIIAIFRNPTIVKLSKIVEEKDIDAKNLILLNKSDSDKKIFFIHPSGGSVHWYLPLADALSSSFKVYGLRDVEDHIDDNQYSIYSLANRYVKLILEEAEDTEIYLGGWSLGVAIVYEVAQQLVSYGRNSKEIFLLDQGPFIPTRVEDNEDQMLFNTFSKHFELNLEELKQMDHHSKMKFILRKAKRNNLVPLWIRVKDFEKYIKKLWIQNKAWQEYSPQKYLGNVNLILSEENHNSTLGWENFTEKEINLINVLGDHISMLSKGNAAELSQKITKIIGV